MTSSATTLTLTTGRPARLLALGLLAVMVAVELAIVTFAGAAASTDASATPRPAAASAIAMRSRARRASSHPAPGGPNRLASGIRQSSRYSVLKVTLRSPSVGSR